MKYYTYAFLREKDSETAKAGTPYYIGKGSGKRAYWKGDRVASLPTDKSRILILKHFANEADAFKHERYMIAVLGRKDLGTGILVNLSDGGEGSSGYKHTPEARAKMSKANAGRTLSPYHRKRISEGQKGKVIPPDVKEKMKIAQQHRRKTQVVSEETKRKTSETMKGRPHSPEHKRKLAEANRARARREMAEKGK